LHNLLLFAIILHRNLIKFAQYFVRWVRDGSPVRCQQPPPFSLPRLDAAFLYWSGVVSDNIVADVQELIVHVDRLARLIEEPDGLADQVARIRADLEEAYWSREERKARLEARRSLAVVAGPFAGVSAALSSWVLISDFRHAVGMGEGMALGWATALLVLMSVLASVAVFAVLFR
jgi:hypothetical protein